MENKGSHLVTNLLWVAFATLIGLWVPIRVLFFGLSHWSDYVIEFSCLAMYGPKLASRGRQWFVKKVDDGEDEITHVESNIAFCVDLLIIFPWFAIAALFGSAVPALLLFKLLSLPKVLEIRGALDRIGNLHPVINRLVPLAFLVPLIVHLIACGWISLGSGSAEPSSDKVFEYIRGVYWAVTTLSTVGYGDISAKTMSQMAYASITMVIGVGFFGFVLSNVASLLTRLDSARESYLNVLDNVEAFMRTNDVPSMTRGKVRSYFSYLWETRRGLDHSDVLGRLPTNLRSEIALFLNAGIIKKVPLLKDAGQDVLSDIVLELAPRVAIPEEKIFHVGEAGEEMFFVHTGQVQIKSSDGNVLATLGEGSFFGELALITSKPRTASAVAVAYTDLFVLSRDGFNKVLNRHPNFDKQIKLHVKNMIAARDAKSDNGQEILKIS